MRVHKEEIWGENVESGARRWPWLVFLLAPTNTRLLGRSMPGPPWEALLLLVDRPRTRGAGIPGATLEQGVRSSQPELLFPPAAFPISSSFGSWKGINTRCLPPCPPLGPGEGCGLGLMRPLIGSILSDGCSAPCRTVAGFAVPGV